MIILDEHLSLPLIAEEIEKWYQGSVKNLSELRGASVIKDEGVPELLLKVKNPTFITINYTDFWRKIEAHQGYCIICLKLDSNRSLELPNRLREILKNLELKTKRARMGKVVSARGVINWYSVD
ncbi:MAG: hypothetical protein ACR2HG_04020 [Pyrinomonadaceae bacterium]